MFTSLTLRQRCEADEEVVNQSGQVTKVNQIARRIIFVCLLKTAQRLKADEQIINEAREITEISQVIRVTIDFRPLVDSPGAGAEPSVFRWCSRSQTSSDVGQRFSADLATVHAGLFEPGRLPDVHGLQQSKGERRHGADDADDERGAIVVAGVVGCDRADKGT